MNRHSHTATRIVLADVKHELTSKHRNALSEYRADGNPEAGTAAEAYKAALDVIAAAELSMPLPTVGGAR